MGLVLTCFSRLSECSEEVQFGDLVYRDTDYLHLWLFIACCSGYVLCHLTVHFKIEPFRVQKVRLSEIITADFYGSCQISNASLLSFRVA